MKSLDASLGKITKEIVGKYGKLIKAVWVYGSYARNQEKPKSDIDILILVDDVSQNVGVYKLNEIYMFAKLMGEKIRQENKINHEFHFQPPRTLTDWWDLLRSGEPWVYTGMRDAKVLYDPSGFVEPIKRILNEGRIYATKEKSFALLERAKAMYKKLREKTIVDVMSKILKIMVETSQAVLMYYGEPPLYDDALIERLRDLSKKKIINEKYILYLEDAYRMNKMIEMGDVGKIKIRDVETYIDRGMKFIEAMERLFEKLELRKKKMIIKESHDEMIRIAKSVLKSFGMSAKTEKEILKKLAELSKKGYITPLYVEFIKHIMNMKNNIKNINKLPESDIYNSRVYVRTMKSLLEMMKYEKKTDR